MIRDPRFAPHRKHRACRSFIRNESFIASSASGLAAQRNLRLQGDAVVSGTVVIITVASREETRS